jgi:hypothetical protein
MISELNDILMCAERKTHYRKTMNKTVLEVLEQAPNKASDPKTIRIDYMTTAYFHMLNYKNVLTLYSKNMVFALYIRLNTIFAPCIPVK